MESCHLEIKESEHKNICAKIFITVVITYYNYVAEMGSSELGSFAGYQSTLIVVSSRKSICAIVWTVGWTSHFFHGIPFSLERMIWNYQSVVIMII